MKKLVLDVTKWRSGGDPVKYHPGRQTPNPNALGQGPTKLLNHEGFSCCLGQFAPQLEPSITPEQLLDGDIPQSLKVNIPLLTVPRDSEDADQTSLNIAPDNYQWIDSKLACDAIEINDDSTMDLEERIEGLQEIFKEAGYEIEVINKPETK